MTGKEQSILIICDMEGISGIDNWRQVMGGFKEFDEHGRIQCTEDVNAVIKGLTRAGFSRFKVVDFHGSGGPSKNVIEEKLITEVELYQGESIEKRLRDAVDDSAIAAAFIGFHGMANTPDAFMPHTRTIEPSMRINGSPVGETGITAYYLGEYSIPVIMATGDQALVREATNLLPWIETAQVKTSKVKSTSDCLPLDQARRRIENAAEKAGNKIHLARPLVAKRPINIEITYKIPDIANIVEGIPGSSRHNCNTLLYSSDKWDDIEDFINTAGKLAAQHRIWGLMNDLRKLEGFAEVQKRWFNQVMDDFLK